MIQIIVATSKAGIDVLSATDPNDFIFHSGYNSLKIIASGVFNQSVGAGVENTYSFSHGLGYTPLVEGFCKVDSESVAICPFEGGDINTFPFYYFFTYIGADSNNIYVQLSNQSGSSRTFSIKYYIFEVPF